MSNLGKQEEAIEKYKEVLKFDPDNYLIMYNWGVSLYYLSKEKEKEASEKFKKALEYNSEFIKQMPSKFRKLIQ